MSVRGILARALLVVMGSVANAQEASRRIPVVPATGAPITAIRNAETKNTGTLNEGTPSTDTGSGIDPIKKKPFTVWAESDTWAATDALGRRLPTYQEVGPKKPGKYVAMFYWTWHVDGNVAKEPVNVELITRRFPEAINDYEHSIWKRVGHGYHWDEPLFGYYRSTDPWVLRRHAEMLADAGVDVVVFDATNGSLTWKNAYEVLFPVLERAREQGVRTPQFAFMLPFGPWPNSLASIQQLYADVYEPGRFADLWFRWKGKPLIMAYPEGVPEPM